MVKKSVSYTNELKSTAGLYGLYEALGWVETTGISPEGIKAVAENSYFSIYAYDGPRLVGTGRIISDGVLNSYLCGLGVLEEYRNKGIGTCIAEKLIGMCVKEGLSIQLQCKEELVPYYEKMGFVRFALGMKLDHRSY